jgi:hypothetical protein
MVMLVANASLTSTGSRIFAINDQRGLLIVEFSELCWLAVIQTDVEYSS